MIVSGNITTVPNSKLLLKITVSPILTHSIHSHRLLHLHLLGSGSAGRHSLSGFDGGLGGVGRHSCWVVWAGWLVSGGGGVNI